MQRELPWRLLADVAYVGNSVRNAFAVNAGQSYTNQLNDPDPRLVANPHAGHDRSDDRQRAADQLHPSQLPGPRRASRSASSWTSMYRNYHAIQFEVRRRLANGFAWAVELHGLGHRSSTRRYDWFRTPEDNEARNTHRATGSRPHNAKFTYNWMIPGASRFLGNNVIAKGVLDGWQLSGITTLLGGTWSNFQPTTSAARRPSANSLTGGLGGIAADHRLRPEPAAQRADVRSAVPHRVRAAAGTADRSRTTRSTRAPASAQGRRTPGWASATSTTT